MIIGNATKYILSIQVTILAGDQLLQFLSMRVPVDIVDEFRHPHIPFSQVSLFHEFTSASAARLDQDSILPYNQTCIIL